MRGVFGVVGRTEHAGLRGAAPALRHDDPDGFSDWGTSDDFGNLAHWRLVIVDIHVADSQLLADEPGRAQRRLRSLPECWTSAWMLGESVEPAA